MEKIEVVENRAPSGKFGPWQTILIVVATWALSTAVNWGAIQQHQEDMARRQDAADRSISQQLPRVEFDTWRDEVNHRLERMEEKIDTLLVKR